MNGYAPTTAVLDELRAYGSVTFTVAGEATVVVRAERHTVEGQQVFIVRSEEYDRAMQGLREVARDLARNYVRALVPGKEKGKRWYHLLATPSVAAADPRTHAVGRLAHAHKTRGPLFPPLQAQRNKRRARIQSYV